jgi:hypothetical protein
VDRVGVTGHSFSLDYSMFQRQVVHLQRFCDSPTTCLAFSPTASTIPPNAGRLLGVVGRAGSRFIGGDRLARGCLRPPADQNKSNNMSHLAGEGKNPTRSIGVSPGEPAAGERAGRPCHQGRATIPTLRCATVEAWPLTPPTACSERA